MYTDWGWNVEVDDEGNYDVDVYVCAQRPE